jgi:hypothetical protein
MTMSIFPVYDLDRAVRIFKPLQSCAKLKQRWPCSQIDGVAKATP